MDLFTNLLSIVFKENLKVKLDCVSDGIVNRDQDDIEMNSENLLNLALERGFRSYVEGIMKIMFEGNVSDFEISETILLFKDKLYSKYEDLYFKIIENMKIYREPFQYDLSSKINLMHFSSTSSSIKSLHKSKWITCLLKSENNDIVNKIIKSKNYAKFEDDIYYLNSFTNKVKPILTNELKLNEDQINELKRYMENLHNKYNSGRESVSLVIRYKGAAKVGEKGLLHDIIDKEIQWDILDEENMQFLIDYKWNKFAKERLLFDLARHLAFVFIFTSYCVMLGYIDENEKSVFYITMQILFLLCSWLLSVYFLCTEIIQFSWCCYYCKKKNEGKKIIEILLIVLKDWLLSKWNVIELITYIDIICVIPILQKVDYHFDKFSDSVLKNFSSVAVCLMWWKLLYYLFPFKATGPLVILIFEVLKDLRVFILVVVMILSGFATMFFPMLSNSKNGNSFKNGFEDFPMSLVTTYGMMLGDFQIETFTESNVAWFSTVVFMIYMLIMMIVMLNLLIAIIGDTFDRMKPRETLSFYMARCEIILDLENKLLRKQQERIK